MDSIDNLSKTAPVKRLLTLSKLF